MISVPSYLRGALARRCLIACALALASCALWLFTLAPSADAVPASQTIRCTSGRSGFDFCKTAKFAVKKCRKVHVKLIDSGNNRWVKFQVRKGKGDVRWESEKLDPKTKDNPDADDTDSGTVAGRDRFRPRIYVDADSRTKTQLTMRIRFSGC